jgi:membrane protease subunit HflC
MKRFLIVLGVIAVLIVATLLTGPFYQLTEGECAVVVRLGEIVAVETEAGLHLKSPFLDNVVKYPRRIQSWDGEPQRIPTKENQFIYVDMTARWRIADPKKFYESVSTMDSASARLSDVIDSAVRTVVSANWLYEAVRNSNIIRDRVATVNFQVGNTADAEQLSAITNTADSFETIAKGRSELAAEMLKLSRQSVPAFGIELIDLVPRQIKYSEELTESVYSRMIKERNQIAEAYRSLGEGKKAEWMGKLENEKRSIISAAYEQAETLRGTADAEATHIYAVAYNKDASFFDFWRAIESYRTTLPQFSKTLSTDMDYFRYLYSPQGR